MRPATNRRMDDHFDSLGIVPALPPKGETSGFAFTNVRLGTREVRVRVLTDGRVEDFYFYVSAPGFRPDYDAVNWESLRESTEPVELETEAALSEALKELPRCTTTREGWGSGDPLNLVIISSADGLLSFTRAGWDETELLTWASAWRTFRAFFGGEYRHSPMSALYFNGRPQDMGLQKARDTIHERNHLRLWATRWRYRGDIVWIGTITRDIGVYFTTRAWNLTTHAIDPDVDEARNYLIEDLFWTDGRRALIRLGPSGVEIPIAEIEPFGDFRLGEGMRALEGMRLLGDTVVGPAEDWSIREDAAEPGDESDRLADP